MLETVETGNGVENRFQHLKLAVFYEKDGIHVVAQGKNELLALVGLVFEVVGYFLHRCTCPLRKNREFPQKFHFLRQNGFLDFPNNSLKVSSFQYSEVHITQTQDTGSSGLISNERELSEGVSHCVLADFGLRGVVGSGEEHTAVTVQDYVELRALVAFVEDELGGKYLVCTPKLVCHVLTALQMRFFTLTFHQISKKLNVLCEIDKVLQASRSSVLRCLFQNASEDT